MPNDYRIYRALLHCIFVGVVFCWCSTDGLYGEDAPRSAARPDIPQAVLDSIRKGSAEPLLPYVATSSEMAEYLVSQKLVPENRPGELAKYSSAWSRAIRAWLERSVKDVAGQLKGLGLDVGQMKIERVSVKRYGLGEYSPYRGLKDLTEGYGLNLLLKGPHGQTTLALKNQILGNRRVIAGRGGKEIPREHRRYLRLERAKTWKESEVLGSGVKRIVEDSWVASFFSDMQGMAHEQTTYLLKGNDRVQDGPHKSWDNQGRLLASGTYKDGRKSRSWLEGDGHEWDIGEYREGSRHGPWKAWRSLEKNDEDKAWECIYDRGVIIGDKTYYNRHGAIILVEQFDSRGYRTLWKRYHPNGKIMREMHLKEGKQHGFDTTFDEQGNVVKKGEWRKGKPWNGWCFIRAAGDAGSVGGLGKHVRYKDGEPEKKQTVRQKIE